MLNKKKGALQLSIQIMDYGWIQHMPRTGLVPMETALAIAVKHFAPRQPISKWRGVPKYQGEV